MGGVTDCQQQRLREFPVSLNMPERNIARYVVYLTALFFVAFLTGFLAPIPGKVDLFGTLMDAFEPILTLSPWKMFFVILLNNSAKSFVVLLSGILFGLVPLIAVATNGYILGIAYLLTSGEVGYVQAAKTVLPHGCLLYTSPSPRDRS